MKKLQRGRFVALLMALTMAFSFSIVAFAAKSEENTNVVISEAVAEQDDIEPMSTNELYELSEFYYDNKRATKTFQITVPEG